MRFRSPTSLGKSAPAVTHPQSMSIGKSGIRYSQVRSFGHEAHTLIVCQ
jgi:hypothetical protein